MRSKSYNLSHKDDDVMTPPAITCDDDDKGHKNEISGYDNLGYSKSSGDVESSPTQDENKQATGAVTPEVNSKERQTWERPIEFLLSCIAMSVGLGNVWRFPNVAYKNGGGVFLIPYITVLMLIGKPMYFLELSIGQFSSSGCVKIWRCVPGLKGIGYGQMIATWSVVTYYVSIMAVTVFYFIQSFSKTLPWTVCDPQWADLSRCVDTDTYVPSNYSNSSLQTSADQYFSTFVMRQPLNLDDGPGWPDWRLSLCLLFSWTILFGTLVKGVKSSGKVAYFTAIFPYVVLFTLLIRGLTLPGAYEGIVFFLKPDYTKLIDPNVWSAAVTQSFYSLSVGFGTVTMYASYNNFKHNVYRDALIISIVDTCTSILAGCTIFSVLGNLKHEIGADDIKNVVNEGAGLAFITYPTAIAKFPGVPQLFAVLFFLMLFTLGLGSAAALTGCVKTVIQDQFPKLNEAYVTLALCIFGFCVGLFYVTPAGMWLIDLIDFFGGDFIIFILAIFEIIAISWIYGFKKFSRDIHFMLDIKLGWYWTLCWGVIIPLGLIAILVFSFVNFKMPTYLHTAFPSLYYTIGWVLSAVALSNLVICFLRTLFNTEEKKNAWDRLFKENNKWRPLLDANYEKWITFKNDNPL